MRAHLAAMPIYEYAPDDPPAARSAATASSACRRVSEPRFTHCPACGGAIRRVLSATPAVAGQTHVLREGHIAKHGFTQYRRLGKGNYEKTAGKGPPTISDD